MEASKSAPTREQCNEELNLIMSELGEIVQKMGPSHGIAAWHMAWQVWQVAHRDRCYPLRSVACLPSLWTSEGASGKTGPACDIGPPGPPGTPGCSGCPVGPSDCPPAEPVNSQQTCGRPGCQRCGPGNENVPGPATGAFQKPEADGG